VHHANDTAGFFQIILTGMDLWYWAGGVDGLCADCWGAVRCDIEIHKKNATISPSTVWDWIVKNSKEGSRCRVARNRDDSLALLGQATDSATLRGKVGMTKNLTADNETATDRPEQALTENDQEIARLQLQQGANDDLRFESPHEHISRIFLVRARHLANAFHNDGRRVYCIQYIARY
jgi:hypothetical protein